MADTIDGKKVADPAGLAEAQKANALLLAIFEQLQSINAKLAVSTGISDGTEGE